MSAIRPAVLVFDVNETLSDLTPPQSRFVEIGAPAERMAPVVCRDIAGWVALAAAGGYADFADLARDNLLSLLTTLEHQRDDPDAVVEHMVSGIAELEVDPDVPAGVRTLHKSGYRLVTMTNGNAALLSKTGVRDHFGALWDVTGCAGGSPIRVATTTRSNAVEFILSRPCWWPYIRGTWTTPSVPAWPGHGGDAEPRST